MCSVEVEFNSIPRTAVKIALLMVKCYFPTLLCENGLFRDIENHLIWNIWNLEVEFYSEVAPWDKL